jgi:2-oxoglutarate dehydrogenase E1 component
VRLSGQDSRRGTFSHRHAVLYDYHNGEPYFPLKTLATPPEMFTVFDSLLSEAAVLGFEFGYALEMPDALVLWEAQFGDFVNGAQSIIDQIMASSESKWRYMCGLCVMLPHGYEGAGPEHSNAYIERFLSLCAENNMQVIIPSTPANYFHALRRQMHRKFRKPLIFMMPKANLRTSPEFAGSTIDELLGDSQFQTVIDDPAGLPPAGVSRVLFCSGKVYFSLNHARETERDATGKAKPREIRIGDTAIVRASWPSTATPGRCCGCRKNPATAAAGRSWNPGFANCCPPVPRSPIAAEKKPPAPRPAATRCTRSRRKNCWNTRWN